MSKSSPKKIQHPLRMGNTVFIRTVTYHYIGRIVLMDKDTLVLDEASWVAWPNKRYGEILKTGEINDSEKIPHPTVIGRGAIVDATDWKFPLPQVST